MQRKKHIGIIVPSSGVVTEMLFHHYAPHDIIISTSRVKFNQISYDALNDMLDVVWRVAEDLSCVDPDIIVYSSVMAGAINGKAIANIIENSTGIPCITGFSAMIKAAKTLSITHPTVISPHADQLNLVFKRKMMQNGLKVQNIYSLERFKEKNNIRALEQITIEDIYEALKSVSLSDTDSLIINAACVQGAKEIQYIESDVGLPILEGDQVSLWNALRAIDDHSVIPEMGKLFEV